MLSNSMQIQKYIFETLPNLLSFQQIPFLKQWTWEPSPEYCMLHPNSNKEFYKPYDVAVHNYDSYSF